MAGGNVGDHALCQNVGAMRQCAISKWQCGWPFAEARFWSKKLPAFKKARLCFNICLPSSNALSLVAIKSLYTHLHAWYIPRDPFAACSCVPFAVCRLPFAVCAVCRLPFAVCRSALYELNLYKILIKQCWNMLKSIVPNLRDWPWIVFAIILALTGLVSSLLAAQYVPCEVFHCEIDQRSCFTCLTLWSCHSQAMQHVQFHPWLRVQLLGPQPFSWFVLIVPSYSLGVS